MCSWAGLVFGIVVAAPVTRQHVRHHVMNCFIAMSGSTVPSPHYKCTLTDDFAMVNVTSQKIHEVYRRYYVNSNTYVSVRSCELDI